MIPETSNNLESALVRTLPTNVEAEQMLIGAILINPTLLNQVTEFLRAEHFHEKLHQSIYSSIEIVTEKGFTATAVTLKSMLDRNQNFIDAGGSTYLNKLATIAMMVINPYNYGRIIYDLAIRRHLIQIGEEIVNTAYESTIDNPSSSQIEQAENKLYHLASEGISERGFIKIEDSIAESLTSINRAMKSSHHVIGISTGLTDLDNKLSGFHNSDLVIIAGRPSMGKTATYLQLDFSRWRCLPSN